MRNLPPPGSFPTAASSASTQLFKRPAPEPEEPQIAREDSVLMDALSDPNDSLPANKKTMSLQEKNRRAQKRFREKQKVKMATLESQVEEMSSQMYRLVSENDSLRNRNSVLEKVLKLRDEQIAVLQEKVKLFERPPKVEPSVTTSVSTGGEAGSTLQEAQAPPAEVEDSQFSAEVVSKMSADDVIKLWKDYLKQLSSWVVRAETANPDPEVVRRVEEIITEAGTMCTKVAILNPMCIKKLVSCNLEDASSASAAPDHWATVLGALAMTETQKKEALAARQVFLGKLKEVVEERQRINGQLQSSVPEGPSVDPQGGGNNKTTAISLEAHDALSALKENLRREHNIHWEFNAGLFGKVMTKLQVAKAAVHSYPFYPDALGIANIIAVQMGKVDEPPVDVP